MTFCRSFLVDVSKDTSDLLLKSFKGLKDGDSVLRHNGSAFPFTSSILHVVLDKTLNLVKCIFPQESCGPQNLVHFRRETVTVKANVQLRLHKERAKLVSFSIEVVGDRGLRGLARRGLRVGSFDRHGTVALLL